MAIKKSTYTGGMGRPFLHSPYVANVPAEVIIEHTFTEALAAADILELAYLPPYCKVLSADIKSAGTAAVTFDVGFMSGDVGSNDPARTVDTALFAAATPTTQAPAGIDKLYAIQPTEKPRSIGVKASGAVAANSATKLWLRITYATGGQ